LPNEPVESDATLNGISLHFELHGEGPPLLLLLHGGTGCHSDWAYAGREFFEREYSLIIPKARGQDVLLSEKRRTISRPSRTVSARSTL